MSRLCATVLVMETVVIWLAIPVALAVEHARPAPAAVAGVTLAVAAVILAALARRHLRWTVAGGSVLQALVIAAGAIVPVMYFLGAVFAALWVIGIVLGRRAAATSAGAATMGEDSAGEGTAGPPRSLVAQPSRRASGHKGL